MSIVILLVAIVVLLLLIGWAKINPFVALLIVSLMVGLANRLPLTNLLSSINNGIGSTLGPLVITLVFGMLLGNILSATGAIQQISSQLIKTFGDRYLKQAMLLTGLIVGIAMFYNAGFLVLIPLVFSVSANSGRPLVYIGIAVASALSITHCFLPPHPGPVALTVVFKANVGKTLLYGIIVAIPAIIAAGLIFPEFVKKIRPSVTRKFFAVTELQPDKLPGFGISFFIALIPVLLMALAALSPLLTNTESNINKALQFLGDPGMSLFIACIMALLILGKQSGHSLTQLMEDSFASISSITGILLIIAAAGAFKQVLIDSGTSNQIGTYFTNTSIHPLLLAWLIAAFIRISIGSATVAALTAAGIVQPLLVSMNVSPELMVIAIGAGSVMCSHVNDTGFWMFKEYFGLNLKDTFKTWTAMETIVGVVGIIGVLVLNAVIN